MTRALAAAGLGVALVLAAATFDSPSLYVPGVALAVVSLGALVWVSLAVRGARVVRAAGPATVAEEESWPLRVELRSGLLPAPGGELIEPLLGWPVPLAGRRSRRVRINIRFSRRGRRVLEPASLVIRDPLRLYVREVSGDGGEELIVLPRIEPVLAAGAGGAGRSSIPGGEHEGAGSRLHDLAVELEMDALRPYREGTPASRIHWPAVARTGDMLERRLVADADSAPLVVLDAASPASEEALDQAVRAAASLALHLARAGGCGLLLPGDRRPTQLAPDLAAWPASHIRLALVEAGAARPSLSRVRRGGALVWVTAEESGPPRALERLGGATIWLVSPTPRRGRRALFTVAGCTGQRLGASRPQRRSAA
jgi:uncharacterized protein (DUF58 family)